MISLVIFLVCNVIASSILFSKMILILIVPGGGMPLVLVMGVELRIRLVIGIISFGGTVPLISLA